MTKMMLLRFVIISHLVRETGDGDGSDEAFSPAALAVFFLLYIIMGVVTYGLAGMRNLVMTYLARLLLFA